MHTAHSQTPVAIPALIRQFGKHLAELIATVKPNFIVPLEAKGAILLDLALDEMKLTEGIRILYPRALDYLPDEQLLQGRFLIVDDAVFSAKTLNMVYKSLQDRQVPSNAIHMTALLNFAGGTPDVDYHADIIQRLIKFPTSDSLAVSREETLQFIHDRILSERIPATYDHLLFLSLNVEPWQYDDLLAVAADTNRLLDYGRRGSFLTSAILLEDLYPGEWDLPPKLRVWFHPEGKKLRIAPIASPSAGTKAQCTQDTAATDQDDVERIFLGALGSRSEQSRQRALYDAHTFNAKLQVLPYLHGYLTNAGLRAALDQTHLRRYYPGISDALAEKAHYQTSNPRTPSRKQEEEASDGAPFCFMGAAKTLLSVLKHEYESQVAEGKSRKDFENRGLTGKEMFERLSDYTHEQVHAAIDYCFDMNYAAAFLRQGERPARAMRATEIADNRFQTGEVYAATIIYAGAAATPAWLISKVFPIVANTGSASFDGVVVIKKGPFGDYCKVIWGEESELYWRDIPSELWEVNGSDEEKNLKFRRIPSKEPEMSSISRDPRIANHRTPLEAALFLCNQFGRKGGVLLNITTGQYGGADYIAYNLEQIIGLTLGNKRKDRERHCDGVQEKLELIGDLYKAGEENLLTKLARRCSRLGRLAPLTAVEARNIVASAKVFPQRTIYDALHMLTECVIAATDACLRNETREVSTHLQRLGITATDLSEKTALSLLFAAGSQIRNWLYALSMRACQAAHYNQYLFQRSSTTTDLYVLAYDLTGARHELAKERRIGEEAVNRTLHALAANWIIAFGGRLSKAELNSGDLRYGLFSSFEDCVRAGTWMLCHSGQMSATHRLVPRDLAFGVAITRSRVEQDALGNLSSKEMDWVGHCLKGKLKEELDDLAGKAGRQGKGFENSPVQLLCHQEFPQPKSPELPLFGTRRTTTKDGIPLDILALDWAQYLATHPTPWRACAYVGESPGSGERKAFE